MVCSLALVFAAVTVVLMILAVAGRHFLEVWGVGGIDLARYRRMRDENGEASLGRTKTKWYLKQPPTRECRRVHGQDFTF